MTGWKALGRAMMAVITISGSAAAQGPAGTQAIGPGSSTIDGTRVQPGTWRARYMRVQDGREQDVGGGTIELSTFELNGEKALRMVSSFETPEGTGVDSVVVTRATLFPISHRSFHPKRSLTLDFHGRSVMGRLETNGPEGKTQQATHELDRSAFDSSIYDIVIGALDLRPGLAVRLPMYVFERGGLTWFEAKVGNREPVRVGDRTVSAWRIEMTYGEGAGGTMWVADESRQFVRAEFANRDGSRMVVVRDPPRQ